MSGVESRDEKVLKRDYAEEFTNELGVAPLSSLTEMKEEKEDNSENDPDSFETLMESAFEESKSKGTRKKKLTKEQKEEAEEFVTERRLNELKEELNKKEQEKLGLERPITRNAFLKFADYSSKLKMMNTALFLFGMKLHKQ